MEAFAERARVELEATGEHARKRTVETRDDLTPRKHRSPASPPTEPPTKKSPRSCSSAPAPSTTTCARRSASSGSNPATNSNSTCSSHAHTRTGGSGELIVEHGLSGSRSGAGSLRMREHECGSRRDHRDAPARRQERSLRRSSLARVVAEGMGSRARARTSPPSRPRSPPGLWRSHNAQIATIDGRLPLRQESRKLGAAAGSLVLRTTRKSVVTPKVGFCRLGTMRKLATPETSFRSVAVMAALRTALPQRGYRREPRPGPGR